MPALDALTAKAIFLDDMHGPGWHSFVYYYGDSITGHVENGTYPDKFWPATTTGKEVSRRLQRLAEMSHAYYVSPTMNVLVTAAAEDLPEDELVRTDDFPQSQGWLYIPGGITQLDVRGNVMSTDVVMWDAYRGGVDVHCLMSKHSKADEYRRKTDPNNWQVVPTYTPWQHTRLNFDSPIPTALLMGKAVPPEVADQIRLVDGPNDQLAMFFPEGWSPQEIIPHVAVSPVMAWLLSCLRIMQQTIASVEPVGLPAGFRKGLEKYRIRMRNKHVTVIEYRRREGEYQHDTGRVLSHRYFRRGHWRRQHYKDGDGQWSVKSIRIQPQIVGDPKLPLMLREHVNALIR